MEESKWKRRLVMWRWIKVDTSLLWREVERWRESNGGVEVKWRLMGGGGTEG